MKSPKDRIDELIRQLKYYDYEFHIKGNQLISEYERDSLRDELMDLEDEHPHLLREDSPTMVIGVVESNRPTITRKIPMLSLRHSYERDEIEKWVKKNTIREENSIDKDFIIESKFDGVAVSAAYVDGFLESLSLRGNGFEGEEITSFAPYLANIPLKLPEKLSMEIRGEVCLPKSNNSTNKRNVVAGYLRTKKPSNIGAFFIPYGIVVEKGGSYYKSDDFEFLKKFMNVESYITCSSDKVIEMAENLRNETYETDGVVIKINRNIDLGSTAKYARNAIAYKFNNKFYSANVTGIKWDINRSGNLIPVVVIDPVEIEGSKIQNVTGHNYRNLQNLKIGIGSLIEIERVGNTVPQIKRVLKSSEEINEPKNCFYCRSLVQKGEIHIQCLNEDCQGVIKKRLLNFFNHLDIKGLSHSIINSLEISETYLSSLYETIDKLSKPFWIKTKHHQNVYHLFNRIRSTVSYDKFIEAVGVNGVSDLKKARGIILERLDEYIKNNRDELEKIYEKLIGKI